MTEASCACLRVVYSPLTHDDGTKSERWVCESCGAVFVRQNHLLAMQSERDIERGRVAGMREMLGVEKSSFSDIRWWWNRYAEAPGVDVVHFSEVWRRPAGMEAGGYSVASAVRGTTRQITTTEFLLPSVFVESLRLSPGMELFVPMAMQRRIYDMLTKPAPTPQIRVSTWPCFRFRIVELESSHGGMTFAVGTVAGAAVICGASFRAPTDPAGGRGVSLALERVSVVVDDAVPSEHNALAVVARELRAASRSVPAPIPPQVKGKHYIFVAGRPVPWLKLDYLRALATAAGWGQATELARRASGQRTNRHFRGLFGQKTEYCRMLWGKS